MTAMADMDLFVGNDFGPFILPDMLFRNNGDGTFDEVAASGRLQDRRVQHGARRPPT